MKGSLEQLKHFSKGLWYHAAKADGEADLR